MSPLQTTGTLVCSAAFALAGCMPGGYVPPTPTAEAKTCADLSGPTESYAQDWGHDQLLDLEASMRDGVVIVRYDCEQNQVLRDCRLAGAYRYMALETRMDMVQFPSPQDIQRGLPHRGQDWVSRLEERYSGTVSADLMLLRVGALITDAKPALADLKGDCQGATHFVRSVDLGARALSASAGSTPLKTPFGESAVQRNDVLERDGEVQACQRREAGAQHPPDQCRAPLKLDLDPLIRK